MRFVINYLKRKVINALFALLMLPGVFCGIGIFEARRFVTYENIWWFQLLCGTGIIVCIVLTALAVLWIEKKSGEKVL